MMHRHGLSRPVALSRRLLGHLCLSKTKSQVECFLRRLKSSCNLFAFGFINSLRCFLLLFRHLEYLILSPLPLQGTLTLPLLPDYLTMTAFLRLSISDKNDILHSHERLFFFILLTAHGQPLNAELPYQPTHVHTLYFT